MHGFHHLGEPAESFQNELGRLALWVVHSMHQGRENRGGIPVHLNFTAVCHVAKTPQHQALDLEVRVTETHQDRVYQGAQQLNAGLAAGDEGGKNGSDGDPLGVECVREVRRQELHNALCVILVVLKYKPEKSEKKKRGKSAQKGERKKKKKKKGSRPGDFDQRVKELGLPQLLLGLCTLDDGKDLFVLQQRQQVLEGLAGISGKKKEKEKRKRTRGLLMDFSV